MNIQDIARLATEGFERVKNTPLSEFFIPTSKKFKEGLKQTGSLLQRFPETKVELNEADEAIKQMEGKPGLTGSFQESMAFAPKVGTKIIEGLTSIPGEWIRSYGKTAEKAGKDEKFDFEDYLNLSDFVPGIGIVGMGGVKAITKEAGEELAEKVAKKAIGETTGKAVKKEVKEKAGKDFVKQVLPDAELKFISSKADVKSKVNIFDYLRTPEQVLDKIGLGEEKKALRIGFDNYQTQLRDEIAKINTWKKSLPKDSSQRLFDYLDGTLDAKQLDANELKVATEIKTYLKGWADKLDLPEEKRITNYITHLFEREKEGVEFPLEIAKQIQDKTAGSVYDPFLEQRVGKPDFVRDVWRSLEAYVKRGTRKVNLDPALAMLKDASQRLDVETEKYIMRYSHGINLRPTEIDNLLDNLIKQSPIGYKFTERPTAYLTKAWRQMIYRGALGLNVGSAMRNLTQGVNTYTTLGEKYTALGYADTVKHLIRNDFDELITHNVLGQDIIQDRELTLSKKVLEKIDPILWSFFDFAEKVNRSSAYFGAKKQALDKGMPVSEAIDYAKEIVRKTQFGYSQIDQPVGMASDLVKTFMQFQSFNIKQAEFLGNLVKDKDFKGMLRYTASSLFLVGTFGKLFGMDLKEFVPFSDARFSSPAGQLVGGIKDVLFGGEMEKGEGEKDLKNLIPLAVPGGAQIKKSLQGAITGSRGYTSTPTGRVRYPVSTDDALDAVRLILFGQYAVPEATEYYGKKRSPLGEKQSEEFKKKGLPYYENLMKERENK